MTAPKALLHAGNLKARKTLGQNFLSNPSVAESMVAKSRISGRDIVVEIGAGLGALTVPAARMAQKLYAVETDRRLVGLLRTELLAANVSNVEIIEANILKTDLSTLSDAHGQRVVVMGNLPYNISSQIVIHLIHYRAWIQRAVLMFQKEMAERLTAGPGGKSYGRLAVALQSCATTKTLVDIGAQSFFPRPQVDSRVVEISFDTENRYPDVKDADLFRMVKAAFSKRRKTLKNALSASELHLSPETAKRVLETAGIDPTRRAETLTVDEFVTLTRSMKESGA